MNRSQGRRESQFPASTSLPADAYLTYISNGVNYKIPLADFLAALNVTGSIVQAGDPLGVPVLDTQGPVNNIRNVEPGAGIAAAVSPSNGLALAHNFTADAVGAPVLTNVAAASPIIRSLLAGPGIQIAGAGDQIQIALSTVPVSSHTVLVNQLSDLPAPVAGVITLADRTQYFIYNDINLGTNRLVFGQDTALQGAAYNVVTLSYSGTGDMMTLTSVDGYVSDISLDAPNGRVFKMDDVAALKTLLIFNCNVLSCVDVGLVTGARAVFLFLTGIFGFTTSGITVTGQVSAFLGGAFCSWVAGSGALLDISSATNVAGLTLNNNLVYLTTPTSIFVKGNGDVNITDSAYLTFNRLLNPGGTPTPLVGVSNNNLKWVFRLNTLLQDTREIAGASLVNNAVATVLSVINTPTLVAGVWQTDLASFFTVTAGGRITYNGSKALRVIVSAAITLVMASGGSKSLKAFFAKNGVFIPNSQVSTTASSSTSTAVPLVWTLIMQPGDYLEVFIANATDTINAIVSDATFLVAG